MRTEARFPGVGEGAGHYESFYIKATRPGGGQAVWIRHTIHKPPGEVASASLWFTLFDADSTSPRATKLTVPASGASAPADAYVQFPDARFGPREAVGRIAGPEQPEAGWKLEIEEGDEPFRHLPYDFLYRAPLPKTKLLSPHPDARFSGTVSFGETEVELDRWPGMVGHNWGREHAERWSWIQANDFQGGGYFDAALGRIKVGPLTTPWIANAVLALDGERHRLGGLDRIRSTRVEADPTECTFELTGSDIRVRGHVFSEPRNFVGWVYADPDGPEHNTVNCSIADLELTVERKGRPQTRLECVAAAAYELGMRETDHGIALQPFADG